MDKLRKFTLRTPANANPRRKNSPRKVVCLPRGRSLIDWIEYSKTLKSYPNADTRIVTTDELAQHKTEEDAWTSICGAVFDLTPYLEYHPGGRNEIMKGAGCDATELFEKNHPWVNFKGLLESCYVGVLRASAHPSAIGARSSTTTTTSTTTGRPGGKADDSESLVDQQQQQQQQQQQRSKRSQQLTVDCQAVGEAHIVFTVKDKKSFQPVRACDIVMFIDTPKAVIFLLYSTDQGCLMYRIGLRCKVDENDLKVDVKESEEGFWSCEIHAPEYEILGIIQIKPCRFSPIKSASQGLMFPIMLMLKSLITPRSSLYQFRVHPNLHICPRIGSYMLMKIDDAESPELRAYTPIASLAFRPRPKKFVAEINFIIKSVENGLMTSYLRNLEIGKTMLISPCIDQQSTETMLREKPRLLIAAGSGITPFVDLITHAIRARRTTKLIYCNQRETEIIYRSEIDRLASNEKWFDVVHVITHPEPEWAGYSGQINKEIIQQQVLQKQAMFIGICGPPEFVENVSNLLQECNVDMSDFHKFG